MYREMPSLPGELENTTDELDREERNGGGPGGSWNQQSYPISNPLRSMSRGCMAASLPDQPAPRRYDMLPNGFASANETIRGGLQCGLKNKIDARWNVNGSTKHGVGRLMQDNSSNMEV